MTNLKARLLGFDLASHRSGYVVVDVTSASELSIVAHGVNEVKAKKGQSHWQRGLKLAAMVADLIDTYHPTDIAFEDMFVGKLSAKTVLTLGEARGCQLLPIMQKGFVFGETLHSYEPKEARATLGNGAYNKQEVATMLRVLFPGEGIETWSDDETDALCIAYAHSRQGTLHPKHFGNAFSLKRDGTYQWIRERTQRHGLSLERTVDLCINVVVMEMAANPFEYIHEIDAEKAHVLKALGA